MKVLIIGLGSIAHKHISALSDIAGGVVFYALRSAGNQITNGVTNIYNLRELPCIPDFVIISNPTNLHLDAILQVVGLGVPLFIEKPPLHDVAGSEMIIAMLKKNNIITYVACNLRFHPCIKFLKSYFEASHRSINEVNVYCGSYLPNWRPGKNYKDIYSAKSEMGGGVHLDLFHELDYTTWIFGHPQNFRSYTSSKSTLEITAVDYSNYLFEYKNFNVSIILNYYRTVPKRTIEILFEDEIWEIDLLNATITSDTQGSIFKYPSYHVLSTYKEQMKYFCENILLKSQSMNTFEDSIQTLKLT